MTLKRTKSTVISISSRLFMTLDALTQNHEPNGTAEHWQRIPIFKEFSMVLVQFSVYHPSGKVTHFVGEGVPDSL